MTMTDIPVPPESASPEGDPPDGKDRNDRPPGSTPHAEGEAAQAEEVHRRRDSSRPRDEETEDRSDEADVGYDPDKERHLRARSRKRRRTWHYWQQTVKKVEGPTTFGEGSTAVGRLVINYARQVGKHGWQITEGYLKELEQEFVDVPIRGDRSEETSLTRLISALQRSGIAVVVGPPGSGRTTLALCGLSNVRAGRQKIVLFDESVRADSLEDDDIEADSSYVVLAARGDLSVREQARRIQGRLKPGSRIVVIGDDRDPVGWLDELVVPHRCPDRAKVFERLLRVRFDVDLGLDAQDAPEAPLAAICGCRMVEIEQIAELCSIAVREGRPPGTYLQRETDRQVRLMLTEPLPPSIVGARPSAEALLLPLFRQATMLAAAVFHDAPIHVVGEAAQELHARLRGRSTVTPPPVPPFADDTGELLGWLRADIVTPSAEESDGETLPSSVLRFHNPGMPEAILERLWAERHVVAPLLLDQLGDWALGRSEAGFLKADKWRQQAAMALGRLASLDFEHVLTRIEKWIDKGTSSAVRAVGWAVQVILDDADLAEGMWKRINRWGTRSLSFRWAALSVYAESMTDTQVAAAFDLVRSESVPDRRLHPWASLLIARVIRRAVDLGEVEQAFDVIEEWLARIDLLGSPLRATGQGTWTRVGHALGGVHDLAALTVLVVGGEDDGTHRKLLCAVEQDERVRTAHDCLWRLAVTWPSTSQLALDELGRWIAAADDDAELEGAVRRLLRVLTTSSSCRRRLDFSARRWLAEWNTSRPTSVDIVCGEILGRGSNRS